MASEAISPDALRRVGGRLLAERWIFAKTMPQNPHEYTLRKNWKDNPAFDEAVRAIRRWGYVERFGGRPYTMLNVNGFKLWTMGAPVDETILVNRKRLHPEIDPPADYDPIAPAYDAAFSDEASLAEDAALMDIVGPCDGLRVLDVGCGTGLLLRHRQPGAYVGIDPSFSMLERLVAAHPRHAADVIPARLEEYVGDGFDLVVCLYGTGSYIDPAHLADIPNRVVPGGRWVVMFYREGYEPVTYRRTGREVRRRPGTPDAVPGDRTAFGNFVIVEGRRA